MVFRGLGLSFLSAAARPRHVPRRSPFRSYALPITIGTVLVYSGFALKTRIYLDAAQPPLAVFRKDEFIVDPATSIPFPTKLQIQSKLPLPTFTLVGLGVRTVSFLGIKVYSIGFYADLQNPELNLSSCATADQKIEHLIRRTACVLRIVPTRSTSYSHLRDGFMRSLQKRLALGRKRGTLSEEEEKAVQPPLRKLKSIFPSTPLSKHTPLDILLTAPPSDPAQTRSLIFRDMGSVDNDWVATEFVLAYFEGDAPSPPLKRSVAERLQNPYSVREI